MKRLSLLTLALIVAIIANGQEPVKVACVGNSITYGHGIKNREHDGYPAVLGRLLGPGYDVRNFGISARTLLNKGDHPYMNEQIYKDALAFNPDIVTIKLGTNDSKPYNWKYNAEFMDDLMQLVKSFQQLESHPKIYLCYPIPPSTARWEISDSVIVHGVIPYIKKVAKKMHLEVIDLYKAFEPYKNLLSDGIHPNEDGAAVIAHELSKVIINRKK